MKKKIIEREVWVDDDFIDQKPRDAYHVTSFRKSDHYVHKAKILIEVEEEPLTFDRIKKECVPMKTLFEDDDGDTFMYIGFNRLGKLITDNFNGDTCVSWKEIQIEDWSIKDE